MVEDREKGWASCEISGIWMDFWGVLEDYSISRIVHLYFCLVRGRRSWKLAQDKIIGLVSVELTQDKIK